MIKINGLWGTQGVFPWLQQAVSSSIPPYGRGERKRVASVFFPVSKRGPQFCFMFLFPFLSSRSHFQSLVAGVSQLRAARKPVINPVTEQVI